MGQQVTAALGGTVTLTTGPAAGASVRIPPNALAADTVITLANGTAVALQDALSVGPPVQCGPSGTAFSTPATVTVPYMASAVGVDDVLVILKRNDGDGTITPLPAAVAQAGFVAADTSTFSTFQAAVMSLGLVVDSPAPNSVFLPNAPVSVEARLTALPPVGAVDVDLVLEPADVVLGTLQNVSLTTPITFSINAPSIPGPYAVRARLKLQGSGTVLRQRSFTFTVDALPGAPTVSITPANATGGQALTAQIDTPSVDPDGDTVTYTYAWLRNGMATPFAEATLPAGQTRGGETWSVVVTPNDPFGAGTPATATTSALANGRPLAPVVVPSSANPNRFTGLRWTVTATDPEGDALTVTWQLRVNGDAFANGTLDPSGVYDVNPGLVARGIVLALVVTASDPSGAGPATTSTVTVGNAPPYPFGIGVADIFDPMAPVTLVSQLGAAFTGSQAGNYPLFGDFTRATDVDGDEVALTYEWFINGMPAPGQAVLDPMNPQAFTPHQYALSGACGSTVRSGDPISLRVTATDPLGATETATWGPVALGVPMAADFMGQMVELCPCPCANGAFCTSNQTMRPVCNTCAPPGTDLRGGGFFSQYAWSAPYRVDYVWPKPKAQPTDPDIIRSYDVRDCAPGFTCPMWNEGRQTCMPGKWVTFADPGEGYFRITDPNGTVFDHVMLSGADGGEGGTYFSSETHLGGLGGKGALTVVRKAAPGGVGMENTSLTQRWLPGRYAAFRIGAAGQRGTPPSDGRGAINVDNAGVQVAGNGGNYGGTVLFMGYNVPLGGAGGGGGGYTTMHGPVGVTLPALTVSNAVFRAFAGGGGGGGGGGPLSPVYGQDPERDPASAGGAGGSPGLANYVATPNGATPTDMCAPGGSSGPPDTSVMGVWGGGGGGGGGGAASMAPPANACGQAGQGGQGGGRAGDDDANHVVTPGGRLANLGSLANPSAQDNGNGSVHLFYAPPCASTGQSCANHGTCCIGQGSCENDVCTQCAGLFQPCGASAGGVTCCGGRSCTNAVCQ